MDKPIWIPKSCLVSFDEFEKDLGYDDYYSTIEFADRYEIPLVVEKDIARTHPEDGEVYLCCGPPTYDINGEISECAEQMYFDKVKIDALKNGEELIPQLHWESSDPLPHPNESDAGYWISCDTVPDRWKCSPFDVVKAINEKELNIDAHYSSTFFQHDTLDNFSVHSVDLAKFEAEHAEYIKSLSFIPIPTRPNSHAERDVLTNLFPDPKEKAEAEKLLSQIDAEKSIEELQNKIKELTTENVKLKSEIDSQSKQVSKGPCSQCEATRRDAERIREEASRSRWRPSCEAICKALAMATTDGKRITKDDFLVILGTTYKGDNAMLTEAENIAWRSFPSHLKHGSGEKK